MKIGLLAKQILYYVNVPKCSSQEPQRTRGNVEPILPEANHTCTGWWRSPGTRELSNTHTHARMKAHTHPHHKWVAVTQDVEKFTYYLEGWWFNFWHLQSACQSVLGQDTDTTAGVWMLERKHLAIERSACEWGTLYKVLWLLYTTSAIYSKNQSIYMSPPCEVRAPGPRTTIQLPPWARCRKS